MELKGVNMKSVSELNDFVDLVISLWNGEITELEFEQNRNLYIPKEIDYEMQKDTFY